MDSVWTDDNQKTGLGQVNVGGSMSRQHLHAPLKKDPNRNPASNHARFPATGYAAAPPQLPPTQVHGHGAAANMRCMLCCARLPYKGPESQQHWRAGRVDQRSGCQQHWRAGRVDQRSGCQQHRRAGRVDQRSGCQQHWRAGRVDQRSGCQQHWRAGPWGS
eukprot:365383-Chlamydomonas_euryale.AAC.18